MESAYIEIDSAKDKSLLGYSLSDSSGRFTIRVQKATDYVIRISHISYQTCEKNCFYGDNLVFILEEKVNEVSEVTVTANMNKALEMKNGALVFNPSVLGNVGTDNLSGLLKKLPSIQVSASGIAMNGRAVSVYINGRKRELPGKSLAALLNTIPADRIKEISIYPGATGMDSASETGRVNIELKRVNNEAIFFMYNRGKFSMDANLAYYIILMQILIGVLLIHMLQPLPSFGIRVRTGSIICSEI